MNASANQCLQLLCFAACLFLPSGLFAASVELTGNHLWPDTIIPPTAPERPAIPSPRDYSNFFGSIREEMPLFPGCEDRGHYANRKKCADSTMLVFIYRNHRYPAKALRDSVEGMAVVSFVVEKDGSVTETRTVRDPGSGIGEEALRIVNLMVEQDIRWTPGRQADKDVRVQFNLPIKFKLPEADSLRE